MAIQLISEIQPKNGGDFAMVDDQYIRGGFHTVDSTAERDSIPASRRKAGMYVSLVNGATYELNADLTTWTEVGGGGGTGTTNHNELTNRDLPNQHPISSIVDLTTTLAGKVNIDGTKVLSDVNYTSAEKSKLNDIATNATANQTDSYLLDRLNHTGTQAISTIASLQSTLDNKLNKDISSYTQKTDISANDKFIIFDPLNPTIMSYVTWQQIDDKISDPNSKGYYSTSAQLKLAHPTGQSGEFAIVGETNSIWIWSTTSNDWINSGNQSTVTSVNGKTGIITLSATDIGLGNVTNDSQVKRSEMGIANGVATLDGNGKVPLTQLSEYVTLQLGEISTSAYYGDKGKVAYDHSQTTGNPHGVTKTDVGLNNVVNTDTTTTANITDSNDRRFVTEAQKTLLGNTSGTNTGDETTQTIKTKLGNVSITTDGYLTSNQYNSLLAVATGDMTKAIYDTNNNGIVDNAEKVNGFTVAKNVPSDALFTDTTYTAGTNVEITAEHVINVTGGGNITIDSALSDTSENPVQNKIVKTALDSKVNSVVNMGLSSNDFTNTLKTKLDGIAESANNYTLPTASTTVKGGIKVDGTSITVDENGVASASGSSSGGDGLTEEYIYAICNDGITTLGSKSTTISWYMNRAYIPSSITLIGNYWFYNAPIVTISGCSGLITVGTYFASGCTALTSLSCPKITSINAYFAYNCPLTHLEIALSSVYIESKTGNDYSAWKLPVADMVAFGNAITVPTVLPTTLTFGATYWNALSAEQKAIFTNKKYTIATV